MRFSRSCLLAFTLMTSSLSATAEIVQYTSGSGNAFEIDGHIIRDLTNQIEYLSPTYFYNSETVRYDSTGLGDIQYNGAQYHWANVADFISLTNTWLDVNETGDNFEQGSSYNTYMDSPDYDPNLRALMSALGMPGDSPFVNGFGARNHTVEDREDLAPSLNGMMYLDNEYDASGTYYARARVHSYQYLDTDGSIFNEDRPYLNGVDFIFTDNQTLQSINDGDGSFKFGMLYTRDIANVSTPLFGFSFLLFAVGPLMGKCRRKA